MIKKLSDILLENNTPNWAVLDQMEWIPPMKACMQDAIYHAEGDVYVHTQMVVGELLQLPEFKTFTSKEQRILVAAALLHDVAKPKCTEEIKGRILSPRHSIIGEKMARQILWDMDFSTREQICSLVRLHGLPIWALQRSRPNQKVIGASLRLQNKLLYALCKADVLGRINPEKPNMLERLEFFKELCLENRVYEEAYTFHNEHSRFHFFQNKTDYPPSLFDDTEFEVIILSGIAGSGKDTYTEKHDLPVISLDAIRKELGISPRDKKGQGKVAQLAYERAKVFARKKQPFVWNSTNLTKDLRSKLISTLKVYKARFKIVYVETSHANIYQRRKTEIKANTMTRMLRMLDLPQITEAHQVEYLRN